VQPNQITGLLTVGTLQNVLSLIQYSKETQIFSCLKISDYIHSAFHGCAETLTVGSFEITKIRSLLSV
jgi:hypothetical protein